MELKKYLLVGLASLSLELGIGFSSASPIHGATATKFGYTVPKFLRRSWFFGSTKITGTKRTFNENRYDHTPILKVKITRRQTYQYVPSIHNYVWTYRDIAFKRNGSHKKWIYERLQNYTPVTFIYSHHIYKGLAISGEGPTAIFTPKKLNKRFSLSGNHHTVKVRIVHYKW